MGKLTHSNNGDGKGDYSCLLGVNRNVAQWGLSRKVPTSVEYNVQLNISVIKGLYGNIIPSTAPNHPMANNALIFFSTNTMKIQNMQGTVSDFWWLMIGMYSGDIPKLRKSLI